MYFFNPFSEYDKVMRPRYNFFKKAAKEKMDYHKYLQEYVTALMEEYSAKKQKEDIPPEEERRYSRAVRDTDMRINSLERDNVTPRFFLTDKGLIEFLTTMPVKSLKYIEGKWGDIEFYIYTPQTTYYCSCIVYDDGTKDFAVKPYDRATLTYEIEDINHPEKVFATIKESECGLKNEYKDKETIDLIKHNGEESRKIFQFCINTLFYTMAFPEAVKDGCPKNIMNAQKSEFKGYPTKTLGVDERVIQRDKNSVTPHFRSGYFRHYTSDRYVNVKGEIRFIEATFVKGSAYTLLNEVKNENI